MDDLEEPPFQEIPIVRKNAVNGSTICHPISEKKKVKNSVSILQGTIPTPKKSAKTGAIPTLRPSGLHMIWCANLAVGDSTGSWGDPATPFWRIGVSTEPQKDTSNNKTSKTSNRKSKIIYIYNIYIYIYHIS
jgi:hypothetical protein